MSAIIKSYRKDSENVKPIVDIICSLLGLILNNKKQLKLNNNLFQQMFTIFDFFENREILFSSADQLTPLFNEIFRK